MIQLIINILIVIISVIFTGYAYKLRKLIRNGKTLNYLLIAGCYGTCLRILLVLSGLGVIPNLYVPELMFVFWVLLMLGIIGLYRDMRRYINNSRK